MSLKRRNLGLITAKNIASFNYCNLGAICPAVSDSACNVGKLLSATDLCKESATWTGNQSFVYCKVGGGGVPQVFSYRVTLVAFT